MKLRMYLEASLMRLCLWWTVLGHARSFTWLHDAPIHETTSFLSIWGLEERPIVLVYLGLEHRLQHLVLCMLELSHLVVLLLWHLCSIVLEALHYLQLPWFWDLASELVVEIFLDGVLLLQNLLSSHLGQLFLCLNLFGKKLIVLFIWCIHRHFPWMNVLLLLACFDHFHEVKARQVWVIQM